jgi:hypothetical protein
MIISSLDLKHVSAEALFSLFEGDFNDVLAAALKVTHDSLSIFRDDTFRADNDEGSSNAQDNVGVIERSSIGSLGLEHDDFVAVRLTIKY